MPGNRRIIGLLAVLSACLLFHYSFSNPASAFPDKGRREPLTSGYQVEGKFALLVGIDAYRGSIPSLKGGVNDVRAMERLLTSDKFGFPRDNVRILTNEEATADGIIRAFRSQLIENAREFKEKTGGQEATVYFHYSGHGSRVTPPNFDKKPEEPDGFDETIVPFDSSRDSGTEESKTSSQKAGYDLRDDEIAVLVAELTDQTSNVVLVFDSCHSGTISKGTLRSREVPPDEREQPDYRISYRGKQFPLDTVGDQLLPEGSGYVVISSTSPDLRSYEIEMPDGSSRGAFSFYFERALREARSDATYGELMRRVAAEVQHFNQYQIPQFTGDARKLVFGGRFEEGEIPIPVISVDEKDSNVKFAAGSMLGIRTGAIVSILGRNGEMVAEAEVAETDINSSTAVFRLKGKRKIDPKSDLVRILSPLFGSEPVRVVLEPVSTRGPIGERYSEVTSEVKAIVDRNTRGLLEFAVAGSAGSAPSVSEMAIKVSGIREAFCWSADDSEVLKKEEKDRRCSLLMPQTQASSRLGPDEPVFYLAPTASGQPVFEFFIPLSDPGAAGKIADALEKYARQKNLLALENRNGEIGSSLKIEVLENRGELNAAGKLVKGDEVPVAVSPEGSVTLAPGAIVRFRISNNYNRPLFLTVLGLSTDGKINVLYPAGNSGGASPVMQGRENLLTRYIRIGRPFGTERIKVIATTSYSNFSELAQGRVTKGDLRNASNPLTRLLKQATTGTRDAVNQSSAIAGVDEWGVAEISLRIVPER